MASCIEDLPDECVLLALSHLDVRDILNFEQVSKRFCGLGRSAEVWRPRLKAEFDLGLKDVHGTHEFLDPAARHPLEVEWQQVYREVIWAPNGKTIRFQGAYTDGGCDNNLDQYWVDNLFQPNHWDSYCSNASFNINCIAMLLDGQRPLETDARSLQHRRYIIERTWRPAFMLMGGREQGLSKEECVKLLEKRTTSELERLLQDLFGELQLDGALGRLMLSGPLSSHETQRSEIEAFVRRLTVLARRHVSEAGRVADPATPHALHDSALSTMLVNPVTACSAVGIVDRVVISRASHFSCPARCGMIFLADFYVDPNAPYLNGQDMNVLSQIAISEACIAGDSLTSLAEVQGASSMGLLPDIVNTSTSGAGTSVEFDTASPSEACCTGRMGPYSWRLKPVVWFRFYKRAEARAAADAETAAREAADTQTSGGSRNAIIYSAMQIQASGASSSHKLVSSAEDSDDENDLQHEEMDVSGAGIDDAYVNRLHQDAPQEPISVPDWMRMRNKMLVTLKKKHSGNVALVKLIDQEDLMSEWHDSHDSSNIDISFVAFKGRVLHLPQGVRLSV